ncbi:phosphoglycolate phosphatase [Falsiroseomonas oryziterrae]|uniref:phosphoglycolate phosphatase n=1 Tax=Falsiroseomonas oryziterrae TaxID=2911368 RepID=UPI001EEE677E|nr:phosphoglycolate phosphatase [Roseomonas sp. NPKOSM-4]
MTRLAVFDLDGTLVDSAPDLHAALDRLMAARGLPGFARAEVVGMIGDGARALVERALAARGQGFDPAALEAFLADYTAQAAVETRAFPGIEAALDALQDEGWSLALCTNKPEAATRELLAALGLTGRFDAVAGGDSFPVRKPHPGHLLATIAAAGATPGMAVMVGDHRNDVAAARGAGVPCVFVGWGYGTLAMAEGARIAANPSDLPAELAAALAA